MPFPPVPVYPKAIDSDYTLFLVHNTTETRLSADNAPWSQEINIVPVDASKPEIWAANGFANIEGELLYYDSVGTDENGKVNLLKGCARQLGGEKTQFNKRGTWIRSYVVAEHHNQLVDAILNTQNFIGRNFDPRPQTLDWRIRNLQALDVIFDDYQCPDINFTFNIVQSDPVRGVVADYLIEVTPPGSISNFRLDFGDGSSTTTDLQGSHQYALNATIDPVVTISNDFCQIIQTPIQRTNPTEPAPLVQAAFDVPIPEVPAVPDFTVVPCDIPEPDIIVPPLVVPCGVSLSGQTSIPSVITGPNINMVSQVTIVSNNPINITQSVVSIVGETVPSIIIIDPPIPPTIIVDPPIPPTIVIVGPHSNLTLDLDISEMPRLEVDWGTPPEMEVALTLAKPVKTPQKFAADPNLIQQFGQEFADLFDVSQSMKVEYEPVGIPSEIKVLMPDDPSLNIDTGDLFSKRILVDASSVNIPDIRIHGPESPIPDSIRFEAHNLPTAIDLVYRAKPIPIEITGMPQTVAVTMEKEIPSQIVVEMPRPIPEKIIVESNIPDRIIWEGPTSIPIFVPENIGLPVIFPEKMPEVEMVWRGNPIEVKITMDEIVSKDAEGKNCVMIVPCNR